MGILNWGTLKSALGAVTGTGAGKATGSGTGDGGADRSNLKDARTVVGTLAWLGAIVSAVLAVALGWHVGALVAGAAIVVWALASTSVGAIAGFLFGIPRVLQGNGPSAEPGDGGDENDAASRAGTNYQVNTNLEQISDWLTKIIVGVGLIEMKSIPGGVESLAAYFDGNFPEHDLKAVGGATSVFFAVLGFFLGYLTTRLYLAQAFSRADRLVELGGLRVTPKQASEQQTYLLNALLASVSALRRSSGRKKAAGSADPGASLSARPSRILWVDDQPANNALLAKQLDDQGIEVRFVRSTQEALVEVERGAYDCVISDMARVEGGARQLRAGIDLIERLKEAEATAPPVLIYTSARGVRERGDEARAAGALVVTSSPVELYSALHMEGT